MEPERFALVRLRRPARRSSRGQLARSTTLVAAFGCGAALSSAVAAQTVVVPAFAYTHPDQLRSHWFVAATPRLLPSRTQYGYAASDFKIAKGMLQSVGFRPPQAVKLYFYYIGGWYNPQLTLGFDVSLSHGAALPSAFSRTFAANHGQDVTVVFSGQVTWPRWDLKDDETKFVARIPFQRPFPFDAAKGQSVVLDVRTRSSSATGYPNEWHVDAAEPDYGGILAKPNVWSLYSCHPPPFLRWTQMSLYPGGSWINGWAGLTSSANRPAIASIGFTGSGGKWGSLTLPFVVPGTSGRCLWGAASELFWPFSFDQNGDGAIPPLPIPNVQAVVGVRFFDQCAVLAPSANPLGLLTLPSDGWGIATTRVPLAATLVIVNDTGQTEGGLFAVPMAARVEFTYQ